MIFQASHASVKMAKTSPVGPHRGADLENLEIEPGTPAIGYGVHVEENIALHQGLNLHTVTAVGQPNADPPSPPPQKWYPGRGVGGKRVQNRKIQEGIILSPKMKILQGVKHRTSYIGYVTRIIPPKEFYTLGYAAQRPPKRGFIWRLRLRLI